MEIVLIGTDHGDWKGEQRLEETLASISPDIVAVEMSHEELSFLERSATKVTRHYINVAKKKRLPDDYVNFFTGVLLSREVLLGYEYCTAERYCQKRSIPFVLIDEPKSARVTFAQNIKQGHRLIHKLPSVPTGMHITVPSLEELNKDTDKEYKWASQLMEESAAKETIENLIAPYRGKFIGARDSYMEAAIRKATERYPTSRLAVIIGWMHMLDDPKQETLYARIKYLKPRRTLVYQKQR